MPELVNHILAAVVGTFIVLGMIALFVEHLSYIVFRAAQKIRLYLRDYRNDQPIGSTKPLRTHAVKIEP